MYENIVRKDINNLFMSFCTKWRQQVQDDILTNKMLKIIETLDQRDWPFITIWHLCVYQKETFA